MAASVRRGHYRRDDNNRREWMYVVGDSQVDAQTLCPGAAQVDRVTILL